MENIERLYEIFLKHPKITTDSRQNVKGSIFFGLRGERFDGNKFARDAISKGAILAVVNENELQGEKIISVKDSLLTLQELASLHRAHLNIPVLGLTGSNGKTTTKELIARVLAKKYKVSFTRGNLNNHIGLPLTVLDIDHTYDMAVVEMGANHIGEIDQLCQIARPTYGLITNIGKAHLEGFGGLEGVVKAKSELYKYILAQHGTVFVNTDHLLLDELSQKIPRVTYGSMPQADCHAKLSKSFPHVEVAWDSVQGRQLI
ncbi:MAG: UDP-N-acetylmuramoyl-tripeptide--D-alanyl-D-alanine ligase, partial [Bacteroidales bacterium]|nr:UDP-N-acetylmuramoyl-tripeptide--D-alanyl-D-alanine ligase [Bacteroidales bacterium]